MKQIGGVVEKEFDVCDLNIFVGRDMCGCERKKIRGGGGSEDVI